MRYFLSLARTESTDQRPKNENRSLFSFPSVGHFYCPEKKDLKRREESESHPQQIQELWSRLPRKLSGCFPSLSMRAQLQTRNPRFLQGTLLSSRKTPNAANAFTLLQIPRHGIFYSFTPLSPSLPRFLLYEDYITGPPLVFRNHPQNCIPSTMEQPNASATSIPYTRSRSASRSSRHPRPRPTNSRANQVVRHLINSLILLFVLASTACFIAWLMLHPHPPVLSVNSLAVSGFNASSPRFSPRYDLELIIMNPNKKIVFFIDDFGLLISYRGIPLVRRVIDSSHYVQILGNRSSEVEFELDTEELNDKKKRKVLRDIKGDWSRGVVSFQVKVNMRVKFRAGRWLSRQRLVEAFCKDLSIEFLPAKETGKLHDGGRICSVD